MQLFSLAETRERLGGISRPTLYELFARGDLASVHIGARRFVTDTALGEYIARLEGADDAAASA